MKKLVVVPALLKAHVDSYTRSDGTFVQEHDDSRQAAAPKPAAPRPITSKRVDSITDKHPDKMVRKGSEWHHGSGKIPASDLSRVPEFSHKEVYGHEGKTTPVTSFASDFAAKKHQGFVLRHPDGKRSFVDTGGSDYARYHAPVDHRNQGTNYESSRNSARSASDRAYNSTITADKHPAYKNQAIAAHQEAIASHEKAAKHAAAAGESTYDHDKHIKQHKEHIEYLSGLGMRKSFLFVDPDLLKSHVKGYTRKDGTFVKEHTTSVQAAQSPIKLADDHDFHGHLGAMKDGSKHTFGSWKRSSQFSVARKGDRFHITDSSDKSLFGQQPENGHSQEEMAKKLGRLHGQVKNQLFEKERLTHFAGGGTAGAQPTGTAAPAKMVNVGSEKWPMHVKSSEKLAAAHHDGSTHHIGSFKAPDVNRHGGIVDGGDHTIHHEGKTYSFTRKTGKNMKSGEDSFEYSAGDSGEHRAWVTRSGHLMND